MNFRPLLLLFSGLFMASAMAEGVYSWRDSEGKIHYSDAPPADARNLKPLRSTRSGTSPETPAATAKPMSNAEKEQEFRKRRADAEETAKKAGKDQAEAEQKRANCQSMRGNLATLESGQRVTKTGENGEREFLDDSQRAADIDRVRAMIDQACK